MATFDTPATIFKFITKDFESIWNSLALAQNGRGCNYALALHSLILLEWAARLCKEDPTGAALVDLSVELERIEPRYFVRLPAPVFVSKDFQLPSRGPDPSYQLLGALFDLVRNGQAHTYHQMIVKLPDGDFSLAVGKVEGPFTLDQIEQAGSREDHLALRRAGSDLAVIVRPDVLFLDFKRAIESSGIVQRSLTFKNFERKAYKTFYTFTLADLEATLRAGGVA